MQFTYSNANFFLGWYIWFCPLRREDKSWALVERKKTFDIPNKLTQNLRPNRYAYSNTQFKSSYTLHPQKHRQHAQGAHGGYKRESNQILTITHTPNGVYGSVLIPYPYPWYGIRKKYGYGWKFILRYGIRKKDGSISKRPWTST